MNALTTHIQANQLDEIESMNTLQDNGVVSDNCVMAQDVADADCKMAVMFLEVGF